MKQIKRGMLVKRAAALVAAVSISGMTAAEFSSRASASAPVRVADQLVDLPAWDQRRMSAFAYSLAEQRLAAQDLLSAGAQEVASKAQTVFDQLEERGIKTAKLINVAERMNIDVEAVRDVDLASVEASSLDAKEQKCLAQAIYYESRGESSAGQMAVADVVLNRVESRYYPNTVCGVVYQGSNRSTGCQFSFTCDGSMARATEPKAMKRAQTMATAILSGFHLPLTNGALNYHATYVMPYWAPSMYRTASIDTHVFYTPRRSMARFATAE